jgi:hypothetical protein
MKRGRRRRVCVGRGGGAGVRARVARRWRRGARGNVCFFGTARSMCVFITQHAITAAHGGGSSSGDNGGCSHSSHC